MKSQPPPQVLKSLKTQHGSVTLPTFFPDGTRGVVKGVDSVDLENVKVEGLVINTYHLLAYGLESRMEKMGDIHSLMSWKKPVITDSGGFQVMSLIHKDESLGKITEDGATFKLPGLPRIKLTPEKSIQMQMKLHADILICLDDCTKPDAPKSEQELSVERTIAWAKRCKTEFTHLCSQLGIQALPGVARPLLFAVVQGGNSKRLRKKCASELIKIGFDGYCFGGFLVDDNGKFQRKSLEYLASILPKDKPKYAMGVGKPEDIVECFKLGYNMFDCVIPTREARHQKLYVLKLPLSANKLKSGRADWYSTLYIGSAKTSQDMGPISKYCDCLTCQHFSRAYLHHLFKVGDTLALRLATIHNLRAYSMLMEMLK